MSHAFVSYSRWARASEDIPINRLLQDLRAAGVKLWLAPDDIPAGADYQIAIDQAIDNAGAMLFMASRHLPRAHGMRRELARALDKGLPVFPMIVGLGGLMSMPEEIREFRYFDFVTDYDRSLQSLVAYLPDEVLQSTPVAEHAPRSKGYIFISYAEEDSAFVDQLRDFLKQKGYGYWDYQDSERDYQSLLYLELEDVIRGASATISVLSPDWKKSKWTAKEFLFSDEVGIPVFLLMARPMEPTLVTAGIPYIDFTRDTEQGYSKLDRELRRKGLV